MSLARCRSRAWSFWSKPSHYLKVKDIKIVKVFFAVPTAEYKHFCALNQIGSVTIPSKRGSRTFRALIPGHCYRVKGMKISKCLVLFSLSSENNNSWSSKDGSVIITGRRWSTLNLWLYPTARIQVEYMSVVKINIAIFSSSIVVAL